MQMSRNNSSRMHLLQKDVSYTLGIRRYCNNPSCGCGPICCKQIALRNWQLQIEQTLDEAYRTSRNVQGEQIKGVCKSTPHSEHPAGVWFMTCTELELGERCHSRQAQDSLKLLYLKNATNLQSSYPDNDSTTCKPALRQTWFLSLFKGMTVGIEPRKL